MSLHELHRKLRSIIAVQLFSWKHACLRKHYLATAVVRLLLSRSLPSNGFTYQNFRVISEKSNRFSSAIMDYYFPFICDFLNNDLMKSDYNWN
jgi:hypothetical protein